MATTGLMRIGLRSISSSTSTSISTCTLARKGTLALLNPSRCTSHSHLSPLALNLHSISSTSQSNRFPSQFRHFSVSIQRQSQRPDPSNHKPAIDDPTSSTSTSSSPIHPTTPTTRHWSDTEPLHPSHLVNPNGRIYSVRHPPQEPQDAAYLSSISFNPQPPSIFKAFLFFSFVCISSYSIATYYVIQDSNRLAAEIGGGTFSSFGSLASFFGGGESVGASSVGEKKLRIAKKQEIAEKLGNRMDWILGWCDQLGLDGKVKEIVGTVYLGLAERYLEFDPSRQAIVPIVALNTLVFLAWRLPGSSMMRFMSKNFIHSPASKRHYPMLTSVFSHQSLMHFLFNNIAFWSFGAMAFVSPLFLNHHSSNSQKQTSVPEASITPHFLAFFMTAGVFASLVSHTVVALRFRRVSLLKGLEVAKRTVGRHSGLGASGAIYSTLVMTALSYPDSRLSIIFLPFFSFPIGAGLGAMVAVDLLGAIRGWRMFDHYCHLGGAAFGFLYFSYGKQWWEEWKSIGRRLKDESSSNS